ncbi:MAG: acetylxylan esterase [Paludibacteraceae bacterium]|nr:acetylxylan esterase [Paludibacteraceae bacterium]
MKKLFSFIVALVAAATLSATEIILSTEEFVCADDWSTYVTIPKADLASAVAGDEINVYVSAISTGIEWPQVALQYVDAAWEWKNFTDNSSVSLWDKTAPCVASIELTQNMLDSIAAGQQLVVKGAGYTANKISLTHTAAPAGTTQSIWTGEKDFGTNWGEWEQLPAAKFASAVEGQILRVRFNNLRAGAQLQVSSSTWHTMVDTEIKVISGRYQDFTITADMLDTLKAGGAIINGFGYTMTEVLLINPADLKPLTLSVPVTDNWVFAARPSITIHVENPYSEAVTATVEVEIATDKAVALDTLLASREIAAGASENIVMTTEEDLAAGFYKATCIVNDDLARAFVFGVNPTAIVSAPDKQADFDTYWAAAKAQLAAIDMNATLTEIPSKSTAARKVYLVEMNSVPDGLTGEPVIIRGYYAEPTDGQKHPVIMHYAGYDSGYRPGGQDVKPYCPSGDAEPDYAEFMLSTRGQNINNRQASEREADGKGDFTNTYGDWFAFEFGNKDSYYYRGAFMDCVQAVRFMASRETSDMSNLFAEGQSQGGAFTYAAAALSDYPFSAIAPGIAFLGDYPDYFDIVNWPAYVARENQGAMTDEEMFAFLSYYDTKNLATSISAPTIACIGLQDQVCPPHTNIAPYNNLLSTDKQLLFNPENGHQVAGDWYSTYMAFFRNYIDKSTAVGQVNSRPSAAQKMLQEGQLIIIRNNVKYNANGTLVR